MIVIGVTGGIGSGKSTVCSLFAEKNIPIFYADAVAKEIADTSAFKEIVDAFGPEILSGPSVLDRKKLASVVFDDPDKLGALNDIIHPKVFDAFHAWKDSLPASTSFALVEAALMFESGMFELMQYVLAVMAEEQHRMERTMLRDHSDEASVRARMTNQISVEELLELSDFQLNNNGSIQDLKAKVQFFTGTLLNINSPSGTYMNLKEKESQLFFHTYKRLPLEVERGEGCYLFTTDGRKYLDMFSGLAVNALGYAHPAVIKAVDEQVRKYTHLSNFFIQTPQIELAERLLSLSGFDKIFFSNSGTEAIEGSIKLIRKWGKGVNKSRIFGMSNGFSGRTMGALSLMDKEKYRAGYEPFLPDFGTIDFNNVKDLRAQVNEQTAAIFLECIQGEGGIVSVTKEFTAALLALREQYGFLIVADEIQSGIGRTGRLFGFEHFHLTPDIITVAKPIGGGLPVGAIIGSKKVADVWTYGVHGTTFGGNPVACAAGVATIDTVMDQRFLKNVNENSEYFRNRITELKERFAIIKEVRIFGYMIGIDLTVESAAIVETMLQNGVLVNSTANTVIRILPPLIAGKTEFDLLLATLTSALETHSK